MKYLVALILMLFLLATYRRSRPGLAIAMLASIILFALSGCYTVEPPSNPAEPRHPITCGAIVAQLDGSYLLLNCRSLKP